MARRRTPTSEDRPNLTVVGSSEQTDPTSSFTQPEQSSESPSIESPQSLSEALDSGGDLLTILLAQQRSLADIAEHGKAPDRIRAHQQLTALSEKIAVLRRAAGDDPDSIVDDAPDQPWDGTWDGPGY
ncbi:hypothetical protein ACJEIK_26335 [Mycobacterium sp. SMC-16]|uniref:hypothetical protein n=1 Tax=Mycobacterium sp. SMC-16 TaxID=3385967 RepID=UPI00390C5243